MDPGGSRWESRRVQVESRRVQVGVQVGVSDESLRVLDGVEVSRTFRRVQEGLGGSRWVHKCPSGSRWVQVGSSFSVVYFIDLFRGLQVVASRGR